MTETSNISLTDAEIEAQAMRLVDRATNGATSGLRYLLGVAGVAGSGKSTLGERLTEHANRIGGEDSAVFIPMDGFHLPNAELDRRGVRRRKGAWFTYDAEAYVALLRRYRDASQTGGFPVYCRDVHEPVPSERSVTPATRLIITEGQYLVTDEAPWSELSEVLDETWWIDLPLDRAQAWLRKRDLSVGRDAAQAAAKYEHNDRLNTEWVLARRRHPDLIVTWPAAAG